MTILSIIGFVVFISTAAPSAQAECNTYVDVNGEIQTICTEDDFIYLQEGEED